MMTGGMHYIFSLTFDAGQISEVVLVGSEFIVLGASLQNLTKSNLLRLSAKMLSFPLTWQAKTLLLSISPLRTKSLMRYITILAA